MKGFGRKEKEKPLYYSDNAYHDFDLVVIQGAANTLREHEKITKPTQTIYQALARDGHLNYCLINSDRTITHEGVEEDRGVWGDVIGNSTWDQKLTPERLQLLRGRIGPRTLVILDFHGHAPQGKHLAQFFDGGDQSTARVFNELTKLSVPILGNSQKPRPFNLALLACFGASAIPDAKYLPAGSFLACLSPEDRSTLLDAEHDGLFPLIKALNNKRTVEEEGNVPLNVLVQSLIFPLPKNIVFRGEKALSETFTSLPYTLNTQRSAEPKKWWKKETGPQDPEKVAYYTQELERFKSEFVPALPEPYRSVPLPKDITPLENSQEFFRDTPEDRIEFAVCMDYPEVLEKSDLVKVNCLSQAMKSNAVQVVQRCINEVHNFASSAFAVQTNNVIRHYSPMHMLAMYSSTGHHPVLVQKMQAIGDMLLQADPDALHQSVRENGKTPLALACQEPSQHLHFIEYALGHAQGGAALLTQGKAEVRPLSLLAQQEKNKAPAWVSEAAENGMTHVFRTIAELTDTNPTAKRLYESILFDPSPYDDMTAIATAASKGHVELVKILCAESRKLQRNDPDGAALYALESFPGRLGRTPLHEAALAGHPDVFKVLVDRNSDVNVTDASHKTPLRYVLDSQTIPLVEKMDIAERLLKADHQTHALTKKTFLNPRTKALSFPADHHGRTFVHHAAYFGKQHCLMAISNRAKEAFNTTDNQGSTPLHCAAATGETTAITFCKEQFAVQNNLGQTPVCVALQAGCFGFVSSMLAVGSPRGNAALPRNTEEVSDLKQKKILALTLTDDKNQNAFHYAAACGNDEVFCVMLDSVQQSGRQVRLEEVLMLKSKAGFTPLDYLMGREKDFPQTLQKIQQLAPKLQKESPLPRVLSK